MQKLFFISFFISIGLMSFTSNAQNMPAKNGNNYTLPQIMIRLCSISYITDTTDRKKAVRDSVKKELGWDVVWGPDELIQDITGVSYSSMYVAKNPAADEYAVVIRGTNYESIESWVEEDFQLRKAVKFRKFVKQSPADACISKGTCDGIRDLMKLRDVDNNGDVISFLRSVQKSKPIKSLYVTGHSLGGTLTPPFYVYVCNKVFGGPAPDSVTTSPFSFAGLTAGDAAFNNFLKTYLKNVTSAWRYVNPLDVAPKLWAGQDSVKTMYLPYRFQYDLPESAVLDYLFDRAKPNNYVQPSTGELRLPVVYNYNSTQSSWIKQAAYQHHAPTYIGLIDSVSP